MRIKPVDAMEKITRQQLCDNFDKTLEKIDKEDIGYVILNEQGENGHVICPAEWLGAVYDADFGAIIACAIRYSINRNTYMPSLVIRFVEKYIDILDKNTLEVAIRDIEQAIDMEEACDVGQWTMLKEKLIVKKTELIEKYENERKKMQHP